MHPEDLEWYLAEADDSQSGDADPVIRPRRRRRRVPRPLPPPVYYPPSGFYPPLGYPGAKYPGYGKYPVIPPWAKGKPFYPPYGKY